VKPPSEHAIGPLIITAAVIGWLVALGLMFYVAMAK
jgi:hypothetical protein